MKSRTRWFRQSLIFIGLLVTVNAAHAGVILNTLGNAAPGFNDGDTPSIIALIAAQAGQPAPFDTGNGNELFGPDFSASWTHNYAIANPIVSASISFGIADHDSAATGDQLDSFSFAGADLTSALNLLFESPGEGADGQYDIYTLALPGSVFGALGTGSAGGSLALKGPGLQTALPFLGGGVSETPFNGAHLLFSTLNITTQDTAPVPEPSTLLILLLGLSVLGWQKLRLSSLPKA